jgi:hypothetical protein
MLLYQSSQDGQYKFIEEKNIAFDELEKELERNTTN